MLFRSFLSFFLSFLPSIPPSLLSSFLPSFFPSLSLFLSFPPSLSLSFFPFLFIPPSLSLFLSFPFLPSFLLPSLPPSPLSPPPHYLLVHDIVKLDIYGCFTIQMSSGLKEQNLELGLSMWGGSHQSGWSSDVLKHSAALALVPGPRGVLEVGAEHPLRLTPGVRFSSGAAGLG